MLKSLTNWRTQNVKPHFIIIMLMYIKVESAISMRGRF